MKLALPLLIGLPLLGGGLGYAGGRMLAATAQADPTAPAEVAAPVKIGQIAVQVYHVRQISDLVVEIEVKAKGAARLADGVGLARLRDRAYRILLDAAETPLFAAGQVPPDQIAAVLQSGFARTEPEIESVTVSSAVSSDRPRE